MEKVRNFLEYNIFTVGEVSLDVVHLVRVGVIFLVAWIFMRILRFYFDRLRRRRRMDRGKEYAILRLIGYFVYVVAFVLAIESLGVKITVLLAGSAALLVGIGLGLQDFFRDLVAGFVILSERIVTAGDIVEVDGTVGKVKHVGLRATTLVTRDDITIMEPNTKFTTTLVTNWSQNQKTTRFRIQVGVAYGSDTKMVETLLIEAAREHKAVLDVPEPFVFFDNFGESSLDFSLLFFSNELFGIDRVRSGIRFTIDQKFRENGVVIAFPQRDIWVRDSPKEKF